MADQGLGEFLRTHKRYWLLPLVLVLAFFGLLVLLSLGNESNFTYTLF